MDAVWSREFLMALAAFLTPVTIATVLVYRRVLRSNLWRKQQRVRMAQTAMRRALEKDAAQAARDVRPVGNTCPPAARAIHTLEQPLANLRQCLVAFRASIQESRSALGVLQECDSRFSLDLGRASQVMHHAFTK